MRRLAPVIVRAAGLAAALGADPSFFADSFLQIVGFAGAGAIINGADPAFAHGGGLR
jgi:hypothetical protein